MTPTQFDIYMAREHPEMLGIRTRARAPSETHVDLLGAYQKGKKGLLSGDHTPSAEGLGAYIALEQARAVNAAQRRQDIGQAGAYVLSGLWGGVKDVVKGAADTTFRAIDTYIAVEDTKTDNRVCIRQYGLTKRALSEILQQIPDRHRERWLAQRAQMIANSRGPGRSGRGTPAAATPLPIDYDTLRSNLMGTYIGGANPAITAMVNNYIAVVGAGRATGPSPAELALRVDQAVRTIAMNTMDVIDSVERNPRVGYTAAAGRVDRDAVLPQAMLESIVGHPINP